MKTKIVKRNYVNSQGKCLLYLFASHQGRIRIPLDIYVDPKKWNEKESRVRAVTNEEKDINLMIEATEAKVNNIKVLYRLSEKHLSLEKFEEEFRNSIPRIDFLAFFEYQLDNERTLLKPGTYRRHLAVLSKLRKWKKQIFFTEIDYEWLQRLRIYLTKLGNSKVTVESNIASVKKFITAAEKMGIRMTLNSSEIKVGDTNGDRVDLSPNEVHKMYKYYHSEFVNPRHKLTTGYFLFSCFTGLRISDLQQLKRDQLHGEFFKIKNVKGGKLQNFQISEKLRCIIDHEPLLFKKKVTDVEMNRVIKKVGTLCGITKKISFHVARHTFATNFLRMGGDVVTLKKLLGHGSLKQTMIYVHIVESEANEKIKLMDRMF